MNCLGNSSQEVTHLTMGSDIQDKLATGLTAGCKIARSTTSGTISWDGIPQGGCNLGRRNKKKTQATFFKMTMLEKARLVEHVRLMGTPDLA